MLRVLREAKHICIVVDANSFALGNAVYSYALSLQKKVSLVSTEAEIPYQFSFLPWYTKVRSKIPSSCDCVYEVPLETLSVYRFLKEQDLRINEKIASSLYASFLVEYETCSLLQNGTVLAVLNELLQSNFDANEILNALKFSQPLSMARFRGYMYTHFELHDNASLAVLRYDANIEKRYGLTLGEITTVLKELLEIVHVKRVQLLEKDTQKILFEIKDRCETKK